MLELKKYKNPAIICTRFSVPLMIFNDQYQTKESLIKWTIPEYWLTHMEIKFHIQQWRECSKFSNKIKIFLIQLKSIFLPRSLSWFTLALKSVYYNKVRLKLMGLQDFVLPCSTRLILEGMPCSPLENTIFHCS